MNITSLQQPWTPLIGGPFDSNVSENINLQRPFLVFRDSETGCVYVYKRKRTRDHYEWRYLGAFGSLQLAELSVFRNYAKDKIILAICGFSFGVGLYYIFWALWF